MAKSDRNEQLYLDYMQELKDWQESDVDQREDAREADRFLLEKDGMWEDYIRRRLDSQKRPRYTFDRVTPVIESMMADIEDMDFGCNVKPAGSGSDKDLALTYEGMIRSIQSMSNSDEIFRNACRRVMRRGFDAWMVKTRYADPWSFEQDLFIVPIPNSINRVWTSNAKKNADSSDSPASYVLTSLSPAEYKEKFPDGSGISIDDYDEDQNFDNYQPEVITIAERFYQKKIQVEVVQMNSGAVYKVDEKYEKIKDELATSGVTEVNRKVVDDFKWCYCVFDGGGMLQYETDTVFVSNPVVTVYGNYEHIGQNSKETFSGLVLKEMDAQRVLNYARSREIEEGALAPRSKWWMTKAQAKGHTDQISRMNVSADPVQFYNHDPEAPAPYWSQAAQSNPHLVNLSQSMEAAIKEQAGVFSAMQGDFAGRMSEDTVRMQVDRGTAATRKWVNAVISGIRRTCEILVETIPVVYDTKRQFTITGMDGTESDVVLNDEIYDQQTATMVGVNDLNRGKYKVVCDAGPAFANRLEAGLDALLKYAAIDPTIVQQAGDVMMKSIDAPLVDQIAERKRAQLLMAGQIPPAQMTEDEKQLMAQQAQQAQNRPPSLEETLANAEMMKAQNDAANIQLKAQSQQIEMLKLQQKVATDDRHQGMEEAKAISDIQNKNASTIKTLAEAEKVSGETVEQQINNIKAVTPDVAVVEVDVERR